MERIIDGLRFVGERVPNCWDVRSWSCNGVVERSARQVIAWTESELTGWPEHDLPDPLRDAEWIAEQHAKALKKSAARAKTKCRQFIVSEGFDEMLTLTYRENQSDRVLCKKHFGIWQKRMKRALGDFRFCASFEVQERGSMHVHIATHKLPQHASYRGSKVRAWQVGTRIWRDIVGADNGLCFVGGKSKFGAPQKRCSISLYKMAKYVSKYILKDYELAPDESNRYSRSNGVVGGVVDKVRLTGSLPEIIACCFECRDGDVLVDHRVSYFKDSWWMTSERRPVFSIMENQAH